LQKIAENNWLVKRQVVNQCNATDWLMGLKPTYDGLMIDPCVPGEWKEFSARRRFRGRTYAISFENPDGKNKGVKAIFVDGMKMKGNILPLKKKQYAVRVVMG